MQRRNKRFQPDICFKCGKPIGKGDMVTYTHDWDAFCHIKCCPAFCPWIKPDEECLVCHVYRRRCVVRALMHLHHVISKEVI